MHGDDHVGGGDVDEDDDGRGGEVDDDDGIDVLI